MDPGWYEPPQRLEWLGNTDGNAVRYYDVILSGIAEEFRPQFANARLDPSSLAGLRLKALRPNGPPSTAGRFGYLSVDLRIHCYRRGGSNSDWRCVA